MRTQPPPCCHRFAGKVAIVTGAGSQGGGVGVGTGKAIAIALAREGARLALVDHEPERARETQARIEQHGGEAIVLPADVTMATDCDQVAAQTLQHFGRIDVLVNNVGIAAAGGGLDDFDEAAWDRVLAVNLKSAVLMSRAVMSALAACGGGAIVNISSIAGLRAHGGGFAYGPSKAAMNHLSTELALVYGPHGVRVNTVAPGHIVTPLTHGLLPASTVQTRRKVNPLGLEGDAWDVAGAVLFLASDDARFITGVTLPVDGGVSTIGPLAGYALINRPD